jgi:hypothetical protein
MRTINWIQIILDVLMLVIVIVYAASEKQFSPLAMGLWVSIALLKHIRRAEEDR